MSALRSIEYGATRPGDVLDDAGLCRRFSHLCARLARDASPALADDLRACLDYAHRHQAVIERFGRFPHRHAVLGRASTPAELDVLKEPGSRF